jgi:predicted DNA-binding protein with PD1-like motif
MLVAESRRARRLIGRIDRGTDVIDGLIEVCRTHGVRTGELRAVGALENVTLDEYDQRGRVHRAPRRFDAPFEIVHLHGNVSERDGKPFVVAYVALSRQRDNGIELIGGRIVGGRAFAVEFVIDAFDDLILRRAMDASTGLPLWREAIALEPPAPRANAGAGADPADAAVPHVPFDAPARVAWSDVIAASTGHPADRDDATVEQHEARADSAQWAEAREALPSEGGQEDPPVEDARPAPGDFIDHPKFGRCMVERIEGDYEFVSARLRNQRLIRLSLDVLTLIPVGREGDHVLFRAESGR